jgi:hypothetical protein
MVYVMQLLFLIQFYANRLILVKIIGDIIITFVL